MEQEGEKRREGREKREQASKLNSLGETHVSSYCCITDAAMKMQS